MSLDNGKKILVIEDEAHIAEGIKLNLTFQGHEVEVAENGYVGLNKWKSFQPELVVLDIMMPEIDGYGVLNRIREDDEKIPILILSAKNEATDKVRALRSGVDDYLNKPFSLEEFLLRVERLLTRHSWLEKVPPSLEEQFKFGENKVDFIRNKAQTKGGERDLTDQELKILKLFFENPNRPLSRQELLEVGWGYQGSISTRTVDNFMVRFRKYFEIDPKNPIYFQSVRSVGYRFCPKEPAELSM